MRKSQKTDWFIEPLDSDTNAAIARLFESREACPGMRCADGKEHDLWPCRAYTELEVVHNSRKQLKLNFRIFVRRGNELPRRLEPSWLREKKAEPSPTHQVPIQQAA